MNRISGTPLFLLFILLFASVLVLSTAAGADPESCGNGCVWVQLGTLNFDKTATIQLQNYIFQAVDYDGLGSAAVSFYNLSTPGDINQTVVTEGEYEEDGDLTFHGSRITNTNDILNGTAVYGEWPCCARASIDVWKKVMVEPVVNPPTVTFTLSENTFKFGDNIGYTIQVNAINSNVKDLKIVMVPMSLELVKGETNIYYDKIYGDVSSTYNGILRVPMISVDTYKPHAEWSYTDSNGIRIEGIIEAEVTMQSPIQISKDYPDLVCTGRDALFTISLINTQSVPVNVQLKDALPFGFVLSDNASMSMLEKMYELNPGQTESISYTAASKTIGTAQVPAVKAVWTLGSLEGTIEAGNSRTIEVNGPLIQIAKNVTLIGDAADTDFKKFNTTINIQNWGNDPAYVEIKDTVPAGAKILKGNTTYKGTIEIHGTRRISYEMLFSNTSIGNLTQLDPDVRIFVRKGDDDNTYSNSYIIIQQRDSSGQGTQPQPNAIESNANRNSPIVWPDYTDINLTGPKDAGNLNSSDPPPLITERNNQSIISKILVFIKSKL
ncbi:MAG: hypothetical protein OI715_00115 (plasmid) [Candidatus Methanoperedens sp.]|nr:MAG: hypothetical protein OI715_00115 [Candidatus Methanoperedens sp.]